MLRKTVNIRIKRRAVQKVGTEIHSWFIKVSPETNLFFLNRAKNIPEKTPDATVKISVKIAREAVFFKAFLIRKLSFSLYL